MYSKPLAYRHGLLPEEIITLEEMQLLTGHFEEARKCTADNFEKRMNKRFEASTRAACARLYSKLKDHGFIPERIGPEGNILWEVALLDDVFALFRKGMQDMPDLSGDSPLTGQEKKAWIIYLQNEARRKWNGMVTSV